jgi:hypothetical protein
MNILTKGGLSPKDLELLLKLRSFRSDDMKGAIKSFLVDGMGESAAAALNSVDRNNLIKSVAKLNETALVVEEIKENAWSKFKADQQVTTADKVA